MSTLIRRRRGSRLELGPYKRFELLTGRIMPVASGYTGYATGISDNLEDYLSPGMIADWRSNRATLLAIWRGEVGEEDTFHDTLPWLTFGSRSRTPWAVTHLDNADADQPQR